MRQIMRIAAISALGLTLSGCIAAAAVVPIIAGGGMAVSRVDGDKDGSRPAPTTIPRPPFDSTPDSGPAEETPTPSAASASAVEIASADEPAQTPGTRQPISLAVDDSSSAETAELAPLSAAPAAISAPAPTPTPAPAAVAIAEQNISSAAQPPASTTSPGTLAPVQLTLPSGEKISVGGSDAATSSAGTIETVSVASTASASDAYLIDTRAYDDLFGFALTASARPKIGEQRQSALLVAPGALQPDTVKCDVSQPAVLFDIDPGDEVLDLGGDFAPNPALAQMLSALRSHNVSVHWLSGNSAAEAGTLRRILAETGIDPEGNDELVLMRYRDDRKQVRRRAVGSTHCLIAIAGEERRDFDELYRYLRDPGSAAALESLIGDGWFLVPPALATTEAR